MQLLRSLSHTEIWSQSLFVTSNVHVIIEASIESIERWWSAQGRSSLKKGEGGAVGYPQ